MQRPIRGIAALSLSASLFARAAAADPPSSPPPAPAPAYPAQPAYPGYPQAPGYPPYYYPPPYQYPYQYPYPYPYQYGQPPAAPAPTPQPRLADDHAAGTSPFVDGLIALGILENRFGHAFDVGVQAGMFIASRVRIAGRLIAFISDPEDDVDIYSSGEFEETPTDPPSVLYGTAIGFAVLSRPTFVLSPSVVFARTDVQDYGSFVGLGIPVEWVMEEGLGIGD
jgi:hypothetical protein